MAKDIDQDTKDLEAVTDDLEGGPANSEAQLPQIAGGFGDSMLMGPGLARSIRAWAVASHRQQNMPIAETANVVSEVIRRFVALGTVGMLAAVIAIALLVQQNAILSKQNAYAQGQNEKLQEQIDSHRKELLVERRRQASAVLYSSSTDIRSKAEALKILIKLAREAGRQADLSRANLVGTVLIEADLTGTVLSEAVFDEANLQAGQLWGVSLRKASLKGANLSRADLRDTDLREANFSGAELAGAALRNANLAGASLTGADLWRADLRDTDLRAADLTGAKLDRADLQRAAFDAATKWPEGFDAEAAGCILKQE